MSVDHVIHENNVNAQSFANTIWNIADILRGFKKAHEYGSVILPFTVLKRFNDVFLPHKDAARKAHDEFVSGGLAERFADRKIREATGLLFYNLSDYDFDSLLNDKDNLYKNFQAYIDGFSENVKSILANYKFSAVVDELDQAGLLYAIISEFNKPENFMGENFSAETFANVFQELIRKFNEAANAESMEHFTSGDIVYLCTDLLLANGLSEDVQKLRKVTVYDQTCGTGGMVFRAKERLEELYPEVSCEVYGQELNQETAALAMSECLINGIEPDHIKIGNTLNDDQFKNRKFDLLISNPPFGLSVKVEEPDIRKDERFDAGIPSVSDGQMLFDLNGLSKMDEQSRMVIIHNASPLFTGNPSTGKKKNENDIRRYYLENDWVDSIVQLSTDCFFNTGISTYLWVFDKNKPENRQGKVQLIDASEMKVSRRKSLGSKRVDISDTDREAILKAYQDFETKDYQFDGKRLRSKVFDVDEFGYQQITIEQPLLDEDGKPVYQNPRKKTFKPDSKKRDKENIPLHQDIDEYFEKEVKPYKPEAWVDKSKTLVGYEIPFTRYFYEYQKPRSTDEIMKEILQIDSELGDSLKEIFNG